MILKFIKRIFILGIIWTGLVYAICLTLPFHYFNAEYPMWLSKMDEMETVNANRNFIIGDSRAIAGLDPKILGDNYYNLALGGSSPMDGYFMLKKMLKNNKKIDTLIVSYAPLHLEQSEMFWNRQLKYNFYNIKDIDYIFNELNTDNENFWSYDLKTPFTEDAKNQFKRKAYLTYFRSPMELRPELCKSFLLRGYTNYGVYNQIKKNRGSYNFGTKSVSHELNVEAQRDEFSPKKVLVNSLEKLYQLAEKNNIILINLSLPMNNSSYNTLSASYNKSVLELYKNLSDKHGNVLFCDPGLVAYNDEYFGDNSHLNSKGRYKFSHEIKEYLEKNNYEFVAMKR